jgi:prolyl-tRNA editing enzyme YbaK/EbsC (Cys-tRNA(Pro) deacylase)
VERVASTLAALGIAEPRIRQFPDSTATAAEAAAAIGTSVGSIVKSLVFMAGDQPILVLASGAHRVDTARLAVLVGSPVTRATAEQVRKATGFAIGGVPPVGHVAPLATYVDADLLQYDEVWASAGTPHSVFPIEPATLIGITNGHLADIHD